MSYYMVVYGIYIMPYYIVVYGVYISIYIYIYILLRLGLERVSVYRRLAAIDSQNFREELMPLHFRNRQKAQIRI